MMPLPPNYFYVMPRKRPETAEHHEENAINLERAINNLPIFYPQRFRSDAPTAQTLGASSNYTSIFDTPCTKYVNETLLHVEVSLFVLKTTAAGFVRVGFSLDGGTVWNQMIVASVSPGYFHLSGFVDVAGYPQGSYPLARVGLRSSTSSVTFSSSDTICVKITEIPSNP